MSFREIRLWIRALHMKLTWYSSYSQKSILIGLLSTNRISRRTEFNFKLPPSNYVYGTTFSKTLFSLVSDWPIGFWAKLSLDSDSWRLITYLHSVLHLKLAVRRWFGNAAFWLVGQTDTQTFSFCKALSFRKGKIEENVICVHFWPIYSIFVEVIFQPGENVQSTSSFLSWKFFFIDSLKLLCSLAQQSVNNSIDVFRASTLITNNLKPRVQFMGEINETLNQFKKRAPIAFARTLDLVRTTAQGNALLAMFTDRKSVV